MKCVVFVKAHRIKYFRLVGTGNYSNEWICGTILEIIFSNITIQNHIFSLSDRASEEPILPDSFRFLANIFDKFVKSPLFLRFLIKLFLTPLIIETFFSQITLHISDLLDCSKKSQVLINHLHMILILSNRFLKKDTRQYLKLWRKIEKPSWVYFFYQIRFRRKLY